MRTMYDAVTVANIPASATLVAGYVDGRYANVPQLRARFPGIEVVDIAVFASTNAGRVLDVENGDATPAQAPGWVKMRRAAGVDPTIYCNDSTTAQVWAAFINAGVPQPHYWEANPDGVATLRSGTVAKQYAWTGPYDISAVADYWPGIDPVPTPSPTVAPSNTGSSGRVLQVGMSGSDVARMQAALMGRPVNCSQIRRSGGADGNFGPGTEAGVKQCQAAAHVTADGIVGPNTRAAWATQWKVTF